MDFGRAIGHGRDGKPFVLDLPSCGTRVQTGRPEYHPGYFGVFVRDPDGNNIEAVYHQARA